MMDKSDKAKRAAARRAAWYARERAQIVAGMAATAERERAARCVAACAGVADAALVPGALAKCREALAAIYECGSIREAERIAEAALGQGDEKGART